MISKEALTAGEFDYILASQQQWREAKRGILSRPQEISGIGDLLGDSIKQVFPGYINQNMPNPIASWSILVDSPKESLDYYQEIVPENVDNHYQSAYTYGIDRLNEWATYYSLDFWVKNSSKSTLLQAFKNVGSVFSGGKPSSLIKLNKFIKEVKPFGDNNQAKLDEAVFSAVFKRDFNSINDLIALRKYEQFSNLSEMAIYIGKEIFNKKETTIEPEINEQEDQRIEQIAGDIASIIEPIVRPIVSLTGTGRFARPGIVETIYLYSTAMSFISHWLIESNFSHPLTTSLSLSISGGFLVAAPIAGLMHETVHYFSSDEKHVGLLPVELHIQERKLS